MRKNAGLRSYNRPGLDPHKGYLDKQQVRSIFIFCILNSIFHFKGLRIKSSKDED